jgi:transposase InsO family protein
LALLDRSRDTYGAPRITARLRIDRGIRIGPKRAARLMCELGIQGAGRRSQGVRTTMPDRRSAAAPDDLERDYTATRPDEKWVADITVSPHEGWLFLAGVSALTAAPDRLVDATTCSKQSWSPTRSGWPALQPAPTRLRLRQVRFAVTSAPSSPQGAAAQRP